MHRSCTARSSWSRENRSNQPAKPHAGRHADPIPRDAICDGVSRVFIPAETRTSTGSSLAPATRTFARAGAAGVTPGPGPPAISPGVSARRMPAVSTDHRASRRPAGDDPLAAIHGAVDPARWRNGCDGKGFDRAGATDRQANASMPPTDGTRSATTATPGVALQRRRLAGLGHSCRRSDATSGPPHAIRATGTLPSEFRCRRQLGSMVPVRP